MILLGLSKSQVYVRFGSLSRVFLSTSLFSWQNWMRWSPLFPSPRPKSPIVFHTLPLSTLALTSTIINVISFFLLLLISVSSFFIEVFHFVCFCRRRAGTPVLNSKGKHVSLRLYMTCCNYSNFVIMLRGLVSKVIKCVRLVSFANANDVYY